MPGPQFVPAGHVDCSIPGQGTHLYECGECGAVVRNNSGVERHRTWHHKISMNPDVLGKAIP